MAIHIPGRRHRYSKLLSRKTVKRDVTAVLSLTAMVDMFTVLVVFLLQNYNTTGAVLYIPKDVTLPKAAQIKELKPSVVVTISNKEILLDKTPLITYDALKEQKEWMIEPLRAAVQEALKVAKEKQEAQIQTRLREVVDAGKALPFKIPSNFKNHLLEPQACPLCPSASMEGNLCFITLDEY